METEREQPAEEGAVQEVPVMCDGADAELQLPVRTAARVRADRLAGAIPSQAGAWAEELEGLAVKRYSARRRRALRVPEHLVDNVEGTGGVDQVEASRPEACWQRPGREEREKQGPRRTPLIGLLTEMPELFADLDVPAHGSRHTVPKARRAMG